jgi:ubiquinone/menaquinone biosynthesis C-methylase UbiE
MMRGMPGRFRTLAPLVLWSVCVLSGHLATAQENEANREETERVADVLAALAVQDGAVIADVGSADGFYALRIARAVAPSGRAIAVDIDEKALARLRERAERDAITNVETVVGAADDPKLPEGQVDAVLIRNAYHEMPQHRAVLAGVSRGLKAGGTIIVIEAIRDHNRALSRERQVKEHEISAEIVEKELREAGFEILQITDPFTTFTRQPAGGFWMIRARKSPPR